LSRRPTKTERREAAKKARIEAQRRAQKAKRMRYGYGALGVALVGGLIAALVLSSGTSTKLNLTKLNSLASAAGCSSLITVPDQGRQHIQPPATFNYNSNPPTSGSHYNLPGTAPALTGIHTAPIQDEDQVHNLEHGHIGIQYGTSISASVRDALETFTRDHDTWVFMAPRPQLPAGTQLAFTRWDNKITCASPTDSNAVVALAKEFVSDFEGLGPEGALPGTPTHGA
jgi:hypothetical protein